MKNKEAKKTDINQILRLLPPNHSYKKDIQFELFAQTFLNDSYTQIDLDQNFIMILASTYEYFQDWKIPKIRIINTQSILKNQTIIQAHGKDIKFLFDSIHAFLNENRHKTRLIISPIFSVFRNKEGELIDLKLGVEGLERESLIHIEIEKIDEEQVQSMSVELNKILKNVQWTVTDFSLMVGRLQSLIDIFKKGNFSIIEGSKFSLYEMIIFLEWLLEDNYIFLGYSEYEYLEGEDSIELVESSRLGIMKNGNESLEDLPVLLKDSDSDCKEKELLSKPLIIDKISKKSIVHRRVAIDFIEIRENSEGGKIKCHKFLGLFTRKAILEQAMNIPLLNSKFKSLVQLRNIVPRSSIYRDILSIFNSLPKEVLFFTPENELDKLVHLVTGAYREQAVRVFFYTGQTGNFLTIMVAMSEKYLSSKNITALKRFFERYFETQSSEHHQARSHPGFWVIYFFLSCQREEKISDLISKDELEKKVSDLVKSWEDNLFDRFEEEFDSKESERYIKEYGQTFPKEYQSTNSVDMALEDIKMLEKIKKEERNQYDFMSDDFEGKKNLKRLKIYCLKKISLTMVMPILENLGLEVNEETTYRLETRERNVYLYIFEVIDIGGKMRLHEAKIEEGLCKVMENNFEDGFLNSLIVKVGLNYKEVSLLRAYYNYYFQTERMFSRRTVSEILIKQGEVVKLLIELFENRFRVKEWGSGKRSREWVLKDLRGKISSQIKGIENINEDRILKAFYSLIEATVRTNYYKRNAGENQVIAIKLESQKIPYLLDPKPLYEAYVYSPAMEGIHLRGGLIARGGIRFSDRIDDYRQEILALMKTQMTKNTLIVPVGAKGGFIIKKGDQKDGKVLKREYQKFITALLEITDNIKEGGEVVNPEGVICEDGNDPYLVVAADKGTAHLSDSANELSKKYGFWLGDGFASGGSNGYDHKKLGITAKGAWESVKNHFKEKGKNIQEEEFTVIGIGDMSGDVFGNGMLLSRKIVLKGAFNHEYIFIDPDPDVRRSYEERLRLFREKRSSWNDYNRGVISSGGGIFRRGEKEIKLSEEVRGYLKGGDRVVTGEELIKLILKSGCELLWNGGIGTYIKGSSETHEQVGDKSNDSVRINANELNVDVIGEGGNLGLTQLARIEYSYHGGRINTDFIDNSAGVNMSDHEVNLKILFKSLINEGIIKNMKQRNQYLEEISETLNQMVVQDNYLQNVGLSIDFLRSLSNIDRYQELMNNLVHEQLLNKKSECLPSNKEINTYKTENLGFLKPHMAVLMAYEKMRIYQQLLNSNIPSIPYCQKFLLLYFPTNIQNIATHSIQNHPLKKEIIATLLTNHIVHSTGISCLYEMKCHTASSYPEIAGAYLFAEELLNIQNIRQKLYSLNLPATTLYQKLKNIEHILKSNILWNLHFKQFLIPDTSIIQNIKSLIQKFSPSNQTLHDDSSLQKLSSILPYISLAQKFNQSPQQFDQLIQIVHQNLSIQEIIHQIDAIQSPNIWEEINRNYVLLEFQLAQYQIYQQILTHYPKKPSLFFELRSQILKDYHYWIERIREENYPPQAFIMIIKLLNKMISQSNHPSTLNHD